MRATEQTNQPEITPEIIEEHGISPDEYERIKEIMGREPNFTELGVFSVMWSEHCSYKSSRVHLKRLPTTGEQVIVPPGENAGVVDIGDGWCVAFKVESHNHPSFIEPFQGAATGVGGILRDVFTMGARPIALMNSLHFGHLKPDENRSTNERTANRNKSILKGVVEGIAHYGNCFGTATVGGEVDFDEAYNLNPLVNAFALGIVREDQIFFGKASGVGNPVMYVGAKTGRDGIHGATMASAEFDDEALEKRPTVQVGDPFLEKLLLEACLEAMRSGAIEGIQDMGAAGLTSSSVEMADRAGTGLELYLDDVPQRESGMTAYEMLLSESQERMLIVAKAGREKELVEIFNKWDLDAVVIGKVVEGNRLKIFHHGELMADLPVDKLTESAPRYDREREKGRKGEGETKAKDRRPKTEDQNEILKLLLAAPNICSKHFVYEQYDHMVRTNTAVLPGADASVVRVKETRRAVSMCLDSNGRFCAVNPKEGAKLTVAEAARNNVCVGGRPLAVTNCLNFASPERPKIMWAFSETIDGMKEACEMFSTPVISGNVSFYNETDGDGVLPTPTIGMVGLVEDVHKLVTQGFKNEGDIIALLGTTNDDLSVSEYAQTILGYTVNELIEIGKVPVIDLNLEKKVQDTCLKLIDEELINSAHDTAEGGLAVAIAEQCFASLNNKADGAEIELNDENLDATTQLFSESPSRILISFAEENLEKVKEAIGDCPFAVIGKVAGKDLKINVNGEEAINAEVSALQNTWKNSLEKLLSR